MLGDLNLKGMAILAPMAGVTDLPFRLICKEMGASLLFTEMINAKAVCYEDKNTAAMLEVLPQEKPVAVQIFGSDPTYMAKATEILTGMDRFALIDVNMGCPVPKVVKGGEGSALMKNPALASIIIKEMKKNTGLPVTVKFRKGWDETTVNAVDFAKAMEEAGADGITVHGRTREQYYSGKADWDIIAQVKSAVEIPVIANGDVFSFTHAKNILEQTGADALMIGRGAQGNPFLFRQIHDFTQTGITPAEISPQEKIQVALKHYRLALQYKGEYKAVREMRKHLGWYLKGMHHSAVMRANLNTIEDSSQTMELLKQYLEELTLEKH